MNARYQPSADQLRANLERHRCPPGEFRAALLAVPPLERDAWVDRVLGLGPLPDDGPDLPLGCVACLPSPVDALLRLIEHAPVRPDDVFVDVGSGQGRAAVLVNLLTGASTVGIEIQRQLIASSLELVDRLQLEDVRFLHGDAAQLAGSVSGASVFFLYCPFSGERLEGFLDGLEPLAFDRKIRVGCVDLPLPVRSWLTPTPHDWVDLRLHRSTPKPAPVCNPRHGG